jgi:hypothetical protein
MANSRNRYERLVREIGPYNALRLSVWAHEVATHARDRFVVNITCDWDGMHYQGDSRMIVVVEWDDGEGSERTFDDSICRPRVADLVCEFLGCTLDGILYSPATSDSGTDEGEIC